MHHQRAEVREQLTKLDDFMFTEEFDRMTFDQRHVIQRTRDLLADYLAVIEHRVFAQQLHDIV